MSTIKIRYFRRITQSMSLMLLVLLPWIDGFRFDLAEGQFFLAGKMFSVGQLYVVIIAFIGSLLVLALFARTFGRLFCGYLCPQTTWSEVGDKIVAQINKYKKMKKPSTKKTRLLGNIIARLIIAVPLIWIFYTILCTYFVAPKEVIQWFTEGSAPIWYIVLGAKFSVAAFLDLIIIRHSFCNTACPYGLLQKVVQKNKVLKVTFNPSACIDCDLCTKACLMGLKPRELTKQDSCISCQECVVACGTRAEKFEAKGMSYGTENCLAMTFKPRDPSLKEKFDGVSVGFLAGALVFLLAFIGSIALDSGLSFNLAANSSGTVHAESLEGDSFKQGYTLDIGNRTEEDKIFAVQVRSQDPAIRLVASPEQIKVKSMDEIQQTIVVSLSNQDHVQPNRYVIWIDILSSEEVVESIKTVFYYQP